MSGAPVVRGEEPPPEELAGLGAELVEVAPAHDQADHAVRLGHHGLHPHTLQESGLAAAECRLINTL